MAEGIIEFGIWMLDELRFGITLVYRQEYMIAVGWWWSLFDGETARCVRCLNEFVLLELLCKRRSVNDRKGRRRKVPPRGV